MTEYGHVSPDGGYRRTKQAERSRRTAARLERETADAVPCSCFPPFDPLSGLRHAPDCKRSRFELCVCTHQRQRHLFGRQCDMPRCRCKEFVAA